jgi:hypothetical protein
MDAFPLTVIGLLAVIIIVIVISGSSYKKSYALQVAQVSEEMARFSQEMDKAERESFQYTTLQTKLAFEAASFNYAELSAQGVEKNINALCKIPVATLPISVEASKANIEQLTDTFKLLEKHSLTVAGIEQVLLNLSNLPASHAAGRVALFQIGGVIPKQFQDSANEILGHILGSHLLDNAEAVANAATEIVNGVINLYETNPGEVGDLIARLLSEQPVIPHFLDAPHMQIYMQSLSELAEHFMVHQGATKIAEHLPHVEHIQHIQHVEHVAAGGEHLIHATNLLDFHFPFITAAIAAHREFTLLREKKTTLETSFRNASLDIAGTGGGSFIGGTIGTFIVPGVGTIIGAVIGAIGGRIASNKIKKHPLVEAVKKYEASFTAMEEGMTTAADQAIKNVEVIANQKNMDLAMQISPLPRLESSIKQQLIEDAEIMRGKASNYIQNARTSLNLAKSYAADTWYRSLFCSSVPNIPQLKQQIMLVEEKVQNAERHLPAADLVHTKPIEALEQLSHLSVPLEHFRARLEQATSRAHNAVDPYTQRVKEWIGNATRVYKEAVQAMVPVFQAEIEKYNQICKDLIKKVEEAQSAVVKEKQALGIK